MRKKTGSDRSFRNSATGEIDELDEAVLVAALQGTKIHRVTQKHPDIARLMSMGGYTYLAASKLPSTLLASVLTKINVRYRSC